MEALTGGALDSEPPCAGALLVLLGPSFAGKSTRARATRRRLGAVMVSLDEINARRGLEQLLRQNQETVRAIYGWEARTTRLRPPRFAS